MLLTFSVSRPAMRTNGMIIRDGKEVNIWISSSLELGKILVSCPRIGDTASPGKAFRAEMDQIPIRVISDMVVAPTPVLIFMTSSIQFVSLSHQAIRLQ